MSRPHVSSFETNTGAFVLSGALSEWLFVSNFWENASAATGASFDQYEDEEISLGVTAKIIELIGDRVRVLCEQGAVDADFCYAWTPAGEQIKAKIHYSVASSELDQLASFMKDALKSGQKITYSL